MAEKPQGAVRAGYAHDMSAIKAIHQALKDSAISPICRHLDLSIGQTARGRP